MVDSGKVERPCESKLERCCALTASRILKLCHAEHLFVEAVDSILDPSETVVQSESSDGEKWCNFDDWLKETNWCVPGDFRGESYFLPYRLGIYTDKDLGTIESSQ